jgi:far upstream element-binding protein
LQAKSGAKIQIDQDFPDGVPRKIRVAGTQTAVTTATQLISVIMEGTSAPSTGYGQQRASGGGGGQTIECAKSIVAKVIGRGGETIKSIQSRSGAKVQIEQNQDPCKIIINGAPQAIQMASQLINEILGTAGGGGGGYGQQAGMNYGNPYGYMMPSAGGYGQQSYPNAYAQNAAYGGYGGYGSVAVAGAGGKGTWTRYETDDGIPFWHNAITNESVWTSPHIRLNSDC